MADEGHHVQDPNDELKRIQRNIRKHSQQLSRDLAQLHDHFATFGIKFTVTPGGEYDPGKDQTP